MEISDMQISDEEIRHLQQLSQNILWIFLYQYNHISLRAISRPIKIPKSEGI